MVSIDINTLIMMFAALIITGFMAIYIGHVVYKTVRGVMLLYIVVMILMTLILALVLSTM